MRPQIKISELQLTNFRLFEQITINFDENLTVFIGNNGAGKTTVLEAIAGCLQYIKEQIQDQRQKDEFFKDTDIKVSRYVYNFNIALALSKPLSLRLEADYRRRGRTAYNLNSLEEEDYGMESHFKQWYEDNKSLEILAYYPCQAISVEHGEAVSFRVFNPENAYDEILNGRFNFSLLKKWLIWQYSLKQEQSENKFFDSVVQAIVGEKGILNDDERVFSELKVTYQYSSEGSLFFEKEGVFLQEQQLSSGEKMLFALVADIARRLVTANPNSENPLQEGSGVVLIDEIDLHLHPKWQRKVVGKLRELFPNVQFVVTTHSPLVLSNVYSKHIRAIEDRNIFGVGDTFGHEDADDMLRIMGFETQTRQKIKKIHRLLALNKIGEAKIIRNSIITEGVFAPLLEIDLFIQRKERQRHETH